MKAFLIYAALFAVVILTWSAFFVLAKDCADKGGVLVRGVVLLECVQQRN